MREEERMHHDFAIKLWYPKSSKTLIIGIGIELIFLLQDGDAFSPLFLFGRVQLLKMAIGHSAVGLETRV